MIKDTNFLSQFKETFLEIFHANGRLFTWFAVALIIISGLSITNNPSNWWVPILTVVGFFLAFFLFFNFKVIIKILVSIVILSFIASASFEIGYTFDVTGHVSNTWISATVFLYFMCLSLSYVLSSVKSRWGTITLTQIFFFAVTFILTSFHASSIIVLASCIISLTFFVFIYTFNLQYFYAQKHMPVNDLDDAFVKDITLEAKEMNWNVRVIKKKKHSSVIAWGETESHGTLAFAFYPIRMTQQFAINGKRKMFLSYKTKNINNWLINVASNVAPFWKLRGAAITPVLVDLNKGNGDYVKTIAVKLPDTKKKMPFGIVPHRVRAKKIGNVIHTSIQEFYEYMTPLNNKQITALDNIGKGKTSNE